MGNWARDNSKRIFHRGKKPMDGPSSSKNKIVSSSSSNHDQPHKRGMLLALHAISQHFLSRKILSILAPIYRKVKTRKR